MYFSRWNVLIVRFWVHSKQHRRGATCSRTKRISSPIRKCLSQKTRKHLYLSGSPECQGLGLRGSWNQIPQIIPKILLQSPTPYFRIFRWRVERGWRFLQRFVENQRHVFIIFSVNDFLIFSINLIFINYSIIKFILIIF